jgi:uncharacterized GH25 family protein
MTMLRFLTLLVISCVAVKTAAHDFWLMPSTFRPVSGTPVAIRLMVGDHGKGEPVARNNARIEQFVIRDASGPRTVPGGQGADPAGYIDEVSGNAMIGYRTTPLRHGNMSPERFETYLREEGLERIIDLRAAAGASAKPGREMYSRSAKAWLRSSSSGARFDEAFGFRLEIVPETDPAAETPLRAQVVFEGRPLEGILVTAIDPATGTTMRHRSDANGRVVLGLGTGKWIVKAVHMLEAPPASGADWESIWATLTFERALSR